MELPMRRVIIALVDDDESFLRDTMEKCTACLETLGVRHEIALFSDPDLFLEAFQKRCFDIVFLDIFFPARNGMDVARAMRTRNEKCQIVFLTVSSDYAVHGYGVNAVNYLVKPIRPETLGAVLETCLSRLEKEEVHYVAVKNGPEVLQLKAGDIVYVEMKGRHVHVCGDNGPLVVRFGKYGDIMPVTPPSFVRVHQSYVVNLARVASMKNYHMYMDTGVAIPVSRPYRNEVSRLFFEAVRKGV